jgi:hypothetical protein
MKRNLLALGSAAVLAVYSAGYERTKEAADRFANETEHRRRPPLPIASDTAPGVAPMVTFQAAAATPPTTVASKPKKKKSDAPANIAGAPKKDTSSADAPKVTVGAAAAPIQVPATPVAPEPALAAPVDSALTQTSASDSAHAAKPAAKWKDGVYSAWGTSRHGDLEA